jgi:hypothetical protein
VLGDVRLCGIDGSHKHLKGLECYVQEITIWLLVGVLVGGVLVVECLAHRSCGLMQQRACHAYVLLSYCGSGTLVCCVGMCMRTVILRFTSMHQLPALHATGQQG